MSSISAIYKDKLTLDRLNLSQFARIFLPVMFLLGMISITGYIERLLLFEYSSTEALVISLNGFFLARVFQAACLAIIIAGQAFVGLYHGANQAKNIGPCVWQMIWFSFISIFIVIPFGLISQKFLFGETSLALLESNYFLFLCCGNFLYPLGGALSAFYLGRGVTRPIVLLTIATCLLHIGLDVIFIFGWKSIPALGVTGAALGRVISQGILCVVLFCAFLSRANQANFGTRVWNFSPKLFWHYVRPGFLRALAAVLAFGDWVFVSRFMSFKGVAHELVFSVGSTIFFLLTFVGDGLFQTMVTVTSNHIGKKEYSNIFSSSVSALFLLIMASLFITVPLFFFPESLIQFFRDRSVYPQILTIYHQMNQWLWLALLAYGLNTIALGLIVASRDVLFLLGYYCGMWLVSFVPVYVTMHLLEWNPDKFWLIVMFSNLVACVTFLWRASKERWKVDNWRPELPAPDPLTSTM